MIILVDSTRIGGISIGQLADYLSLVALTNPPVDAPTDRRSILGLFGGTEADPAQTELTNVDLSLLMSLYTIREEFGASQQRESMVSQMAKELRRGGAPPTVSQPSAERHPLVITCESATSLGLPSQLSLGNSK
ncbi:MAG: hypothetical protein H0W71_01440 [Sphingomonas sp.]|nr:hypothetical protein [Sphingomonas sp.]